MLYCDIDGVLIDTKGEVFRCYKICTGITREDFEKTVWGKPCPFNKLVQEQKNRIFDVSRCIVSEAATQIVRAWAMTQPVTFVTSGSQEATAVKMEYVGFSRYPTLCGVDKTSQRWASDRYSWNDLVIDDDIRVINVARWAGTPAIHWTEFLRVLP